MLDEQSGDRRGFSSGGVRHAGTQNDGRTGLGEFNGDGKRSQIYADSGGASRFLYVAKPSKRERGEGNTHPTVKSIALMRWLARLITPPGGVVLDPFMGSGSTGLACRAEGFDFIGIEREAEYFAIASGRLERATLAEAE